MILYILGLQCIAKKITKGNKRVIWSKTIKIFMRIIFWNSNIWRRNHK